jgi:hypothetical protein
MTAHRRDEWLSRDDRTLLADCEVDTYRASGPGGQKRNKTSSAVRLRHLPTGCAVIAEESRSQQANREKALRRLRMAIALRVRCPPPDSGGSVPGDVAACLTPAGRLEVSPRNPAYPRVVAAVLDVLAWHSGAVAEAAASMGISTAQLARFLCREGDVMAEANRLRQRAGHKPLVAPAGRKKTARRR